MQQLNRNFLLNIHFDSLSYLNYDEYPTVGVYNLVSNIGGIIGLLLGMSLLSVFEIIEIFIFNIVLIVQHKYKQFKLKRKQNQQHSVVV